MSDGDSFDRMMHDECEKERAALEAENAELVTKCNRLTALVRSLVDLVDESKGVAGFHLNGDVAEWDEFEFISRAKAELEGR